MGNLFSSVRFKFALGLGFLSGSILLSAMLLLEQDFRASLIRENIDKGVAVANIVALNIEDPLLTGDDLYLFSIIRNALLSPGIRYAAITDRNHQVRAADDMSLVGKPFQIPANAELIEKTSHYCVQRLQQTQNPILDIEVPVVSKADQSLTLGNIHLGLSEELITRAIVAMRLKLLSLSISVMLLGGILAFFLSGLAVRPIHALVAGVKAVGAGDLHQRIDLKRKDELGILTDAFNDMTSSLREKEYIKNTFERYVSKELARQILQHKDALKLGGEEKNVTILFCDLRGFTSLSEKLTPPEVVEFLNLYFTEVIAAVGRHDGMVDKFMGDAVMVLFGAPVTVGNEAAKALRCALEIKDVVVRINEGLLSKGRPEIAVGIGINSGPVIAGNIGSQNRMEYTVIGDNVNLASRLEGLNKLYDTTILLSESTRDAIADKEIALLEIDTVKVVGKKNAVKIYTLTQGDVAVSKQFVEALALYRQGRFTDARNLFEQLARDHGDRPSAVFARRCDDYLSAPPHDWHGVYNADSK